MTVPKRGSPACMHRAWIRKVNRIWIPSIPINSSCYWEQLGLCAAKALIKITNKGSRWTLGEPPKQLKGRAAPPQVRSDHHLPDAVTQTVTGVITRVTEIVTQRVLLKQEWHTGPLTPGSTTQQVTSHHTEPLNHTSILRVTRRRARLTGGTQKKDVPEIIIVRNGVTAFF